MGGKNSKPAFSRFDDLVGDHSDVFAKLKEVLVALGLKQPSAAKKQKQRQKAAPELATCSSSSGSSDPVTILSAVVPPLNPIMRISVSSAASTARGEAESIFACVDQEQQRRDKEEALHALAAAAAAAERYTDSSSSSSGGCRQRFTEDEKQALRDSGKAAREADSQQLAARVEQSDAALRRLSQQGREQWFQDNAQQQQTDAPEEGFEEEWAALPPEVLEMVAQLQARG
ncbi:hypothetical protein OEZ86_004466 [Tetradesmus obliquus]|nr:hypothetical protein OEZ86_004466 [Tetradesmus obliquus]